VVSHRLHRGTAQHRTCWAARAAVLTVAGAAVALSPPPAEARPGDDSPAQVAAHVDRLYAQAERATERYDAAAEKVRDLERRVERVRDRAARGQDEVNQLRDALGTLAGAQYRSGGIDPTVALLLSGDPEHYLAKAAMLDRISLRRHDELHRLLDAERELRQQQAEVSRTLGRLQEQRERLRTSKAAVQRRLNAARRLLDDLTPRQQAERRRVSRSSGRPPVLTGDAAASSSRAAAAVAAVRSAIGAPYVWGADGPHAFDCSGLTQWAYRQAGVALPRTAQGQRDAGRRVPLSQIRPGDLVVYRDDASHVAMYVGGGKVVHAPYPGASVRYDPVGMMPVTAVTRP
jgi:cell wall-associated NlpC family hydrolase